MYQEDRFNKYIEKYKKLKLKDKQKVIINLLKEDIAFLQKLTEETYPSEFSGEMLYNREILDMNKQEYTEDDFSEAVLVYCYSIRELLAEYLEKGEI